MSTSDHDAYMFDSVLILLYLVSFGATFLCACFTQVIRGKREDNIDPTVMDWFLCVLGAVLATTAFGLMVWWCWKYPPKLPDDSSQLNVTGILVGVCVLVMVAYMGVVLGDSFGLLVYVPKKYENLFRSLQSIRLDHL